MRKAMGKLYRLPGAEAKRFMAQFKDTWDRGIKDNNISVELENLEPVLKLRSYGFNNRTQQLCVQATRMLI